MLLEERGGHLGIAIDATNGFVAFFLYLSCFEHSFSDSRGWFAFGSFGNVFKRYAFYLDLYVNSIHERPRNLVHISLNLCGRTSAFACGMMKIAAWAWIHGCHQHERTRQSDIISRTRDCNHSVLQGLAKGFKNRTRKFGQLITPKRLAPLGENQYLCTQNNINQPHKYIIVGAKLLKIKEIQL